MVDRSRLLELAALCVMNGAITTAVLRTHVTYLTKVQDSLVDSLRSLVDRVNTINTKLEVHIAQRGPNH